MKTAESPGPALCALPLIESTSPAAEATRPDGPQTIRQSFGRRTLHPATFWLADALLELDRFVQRDAGTRLPK